MSNNKGLCDFRELFPTKISFFVFISYMGLFINQGILVTATKDANNNYNYNTIAVVLFTEVVKLIIASFIYLKDHRFDEMIKEIKANKMVLVRYFIPSSLYCLYNNLTFVNLSSYDPTTYFLLLQFRVVVTGVIFQILFSKNLSRIQWLSLILLTVGCIIKQVGHVKSNKMSSINSENLTGHSTSKAVIAAEATKTTVPGDYFNFHLLLIMLQVFASCFAGVYNEYLLKDTSNNNAHIMIQNVFMYIDSIICNIILMFFSVYITFGKVNSDEVQNNSLTEIFSYNTLIQLFEFKVFIIILNNAAIGIVTSLFLKSLNSILKAFASALELMFTAILSWIIFNIPLDVNTFIAIFVVSFSTWLYSRNPVHNPPKSTSNESSNVRKPLV